MVPVFVPLQGLLGFLDKELGDPGGDSDLELSVFQHRSQSWFPAVKKDVRDTEPIHPPSQSSTHGEETSWHLGQVPGEEIASSS